MSVTKENIENKISWFNNEVVCIKNSFQLWISELGHQIITQEVEITKTEEPSGTYKTKQFDFIIDGSAAIPDLKMLNRNISIKPSYQFYGI